MLSKRIESNRDVDNVLMVDREELITEEHLVNGSAVVYGGRGV
jgi:hypothetical protein